jgi:hypothetical protein
MSNKELVGDLLERLPDNVSVMDIAREIEFVAGVREGFAQLDLGEGNRETTAFMGCKVVLSPA